MPQVLNGRSFMSIIPREIRVRVRMRVGDRGLIRNGTYSEDFLYEIEEMVVRLRDSKKNKGSNQKQNKITNKGPIRNKIK